jgi:hypothetical protein
MPERKLYLFDTFQSFNAGELDRDIVHYGQKEALLGLNRLLKETCAASVLAEMPHPESVVVKKGYFPDTFDLYDERFLFVHIDPDLYAPTKAGLELFYPRLLKPGAILVHDYFGLAGVTNAVDEFLAAHPAACSMTIGDHLSLAIIKP